MPMKRRATGRGRGRARKRARVARVPRMRSSFMRSQALSLKRTFRLEYWQPSTATTNDFWRYYSFTWAQLPSLSEFQALFDTGRISAIKVTFRPRFDNYSGNDTTDTTAPGITNQTGTNVHVIVDPKWVGAPTGTYSNATLNTFLEQGGVRSYKGTSPFSIYFKPTINQTVGAVQGMRRRAPFLLLDSSSNATGSPHYGFHIFMQDPNMNGSFGNAYDVFVTYYMQFRGTK